MDYPYVFEFCTIKMAMLRAAAKWSKVQHMKPMSFSMFPTMDAISDTDWMEALNRIRVQLNGTLVAVLCEADIQMLYVMACDAPNYVEDVPPKRVEHKSELTSTVHSVLLKLNTNAFPRASGWPSYLMQHVSGRSITYYTGTPVKLLDDAHVKFFDELPRLEIEPCTEKSYAGLLKHALARKKQSESDRNSAMKKLYPMPTTKSGGRKTDGSRR